MLPDLVPAKYFAIFIIGYAVTWVLTPLVGAFATRLGAIDQPGGRRLHSVPTPRCGGVAVFFGFHLAALATFQISTAFDWRFGFTLVNFEWWALLFMASTLLLVVGLIDDIRGLSPLMKLLGQTVPAALMYFSGVRVGGVFGVEFPMLIDFTATIIWHVAIINAFNLIDGHDGLAGGLAAIAALGIGGTFIFRNLPLEALLMAGFVGACIGFLRHNFHPASIFLGDSGSMFLGFVLASFTLSTSSKGTGLAAIWVPLLALGVPIYDTTLAIIRRAGWKLLRVLQGLPVPHGIMSADVDHVHHRLTRYGLTPRSVTASLYLANSTLVLLGLLSLIWNDRALGFFSVLFVAGAFVSLRYMARREVEQLGLVLVELVTQPRLKLAAGVTYFVLDLIGLALALFFLQLLINQFIDPTWTLQTETTLLSAALVPMLLVSLVFEPYRWMWSKEGQTEGVRRTIALAAWLLPPLGYLMLRREGPHSFTALLVSSIGLSTGVFFLVRYLPQVAQKLVNRLQKPAAHES